MRPEESGMKLPNWKRPGAWLRAGALLLAAGMALTWMGACQSTLPNQNPVGESFPRVSGEDLTGETVALPVEGPAVYLVGYKQNAQFDADRWILGILQAGLDLPLYEVPTLKGLFPRVFGNMIDEGMRSGIPEGDWQSVVTLYGENASQIARFTGTENGRNMRVLVVDGEGQVRWFHDDGYSARVMLELQALARQLAAASN